MQLVSMELKNDPSSLAPESRVPFQLTNPLAPNRAKRVEREQEWGGNLGPEEQVPGRIRPPRLRTQQLKVTNRHLQNSYLFWELFFDWAGGWGVSKQ